jgi:hypothetical protein
MTGSRYSILDGIHKSIASSEFAEGPRAALENSNDGLDGVATLDLDSDSEWMLSQRDNCRVLISPQSRLEELAKTGGS